MKNTYEYARGFAVFCLMTGTALSLAACGGAKEKLGLTKKSPDEFAVVKRAPLSMPPDYTLRPPTPGAPRPQEQSPQAAARQSVFGADDGQAGTQTQYTGDDAAFLNSAGAVNTNPDIRRAVDSETAILDEKERPVVKRILGMKSPEQAPANVVNAKKEAERLENNKTQGKPVTSGQTPSVEQQ
jgi:hypothetical protein